MDNSEHIDVGNRPPRISDTAEWRQIIHISDRGLSVFLKNIENPIMPVQQVFSRQWEGTVENLLRNIENAVYDFPQMLDDFSTDIVIQTSKVLWVPESVLDSEEMEETIYNSVYTGEPEDIMVDHLGDIACLYKLANGLQSFLRRTFAGARIVSHLSPPVLKFRERGGELPVVYIDIRDREADFYAFDSRMMLMCATHSWNNVNDIAYHLFNILDVYSLDPHKVQVSLSGLRKERNELMPILRKFIDFVILTMLPKLVGDSEMSLATALCAHRPPKGLVNRSKGTNQR